VLLVEDDDDARKLLGTMLKRYGARVTSTNPAAEALNVFTEQLPYVLISDIGMPEEDGYSLIRRVRALDPARGGATPAVALTAYARSEDRTRSIVAGFQMHIAKPVEPSELIAVVASLAGRNR
jgi:CheY-like chemotaxis protein